MHVLTKIFVVLVSLLAVFLVPLVVVYAYNENSFKARFQDAEARAYTAQEALKAAEASRGSTEQRLTNTLEDYKRQVTDLDKAKAALDATVRALQSQLATTSSTQAGITSNIQAIRGALESGQQLTESLVNEVRELRSNAVAIEQQKVDLDEALRDVTSQLEVAEQARRALAEELTRLKDEHNKAMADLGRAIAGGFDVKGKESRVTMGIMPDKSLTATVVRVDRNSGQVLAEIDAGSRDGVKEGWNMTIGSGGTFIANLRIINVDVNRATGVVTLEDPKGRGPVQVGYKASSVAGQS